MFSKVFGIWIGLQLLSGAYALAQTNSESMDVAVHGPSGAFLLMDGQAMGKLPLPGNLTVPAGQHRFRLEQGKLSLESDSLTFSGGGQAELNFAISGRSLVSVLRSSDGLLLFTEPNVLPRTLAEGLHKSVASAAKQQHSILLSAEKHGALYRHRSALVRCIETGLCQEAQLPNSQVSYVLRLSIEQGTPSQKSRRMELSKRTQDPT